MSLLLSSLIWQGNSTPWELPNPATLHRCGASNRLSANKMLLNPTLHFVSSSYIRSHVATNIRMNAERHRNMPVTVLMLKEGNRTLPVVRPVYWLGVNIESPRITFNDEFHYWRISNVRCFNRAYSVILFWQTENKQLLHQPTFLISKNNGVAYVITFSVSVCQCITLNPWKPDSVALRVRMCHPVIVVR